MNEFSEESKTPDPLLPVDPAEGKSDFYELDFQKLNRRLKRLELISILSFISLIVILIFCFLNQPTGDADVALQASQNELPGNLSPSEIDSIGKSLVDAYNSNDVETLYSVLGPYAQTMVSSKEMAEAKKSIDVLGTIGKFSYSHHEFLGHEDGADWHALNYVANYAVGNGTIQITLRVVDNEYEIAGFNMYVPNMDFDALE